MNILKQIKENIDTKFLTQSGELQIMSADNYMNVLKENQTKIIEIDRDYVQKFIKIGSYLKSTQKNIINIFEKTVGDEFIDNKIHVKTYGFFRKKSRFDGGNNLEVTYYNNYYLQTENDDYIKKTESNPKYKPWTKEQLPKLISEDYNIDIKIVSKEVERQFEKIKKEFEFYIRKEGPYEVSDILQKLNQHIKSYQSLVISSFKMIKSLNEDDMITFYEIYEVFDKLGIFDTQWQKSMLEKLGDVTSSLQDVTDSLNKVNSTIQKGMDNLSTEIVNMSTDLSSGFDLVSTEIVNMSTDLSSGLDNLSSDIQSLDS